MAFKPTHVRRKSCLLLYILCDSLRSPNIIQAAQTNIMCKCASSIPNIQLIINIYTRYIS